MTTSAEIRACPYCDGEILAKALQCRHCRRWMPEILTAQVEEPEPLPATGLAGVSNAQRLLHLALLSVLTLGSYDLYWFWRNWRDLRDHFGVRVQPAWRTAGLLVPIVNVVLVYDQLRMISEQCEEGGVSPAYSAGLVTAAFFAIAIAGNMTLLWPLSLLNVVPLLQVQAALNRLWSHTQPGTAVRVRFLRQEIAAMIAGTMLAAVALLRAFQSLAPQ